MTRISAFLATAIGRVLSVVLICALVLVVVHQCRAGRQAGRQAALSAKQGKSASDSGQDAVGVVGAVSGRNSASDNLTRENDDAIRNAPGANAPVDAGVRDAGLDGLCKRAAYRGGPRCLQRPAAGGVGPGGAGGSAP